MSAGNGRIQARLEAPADTGAGRPDVFEDAWYGDGEGAAISGLRSVFLWTPVALAMSILMLGGVLERLPDIRRGILELSVPWVPLHLRSRDGGLRFSARFEGG